jgi:hypothetical protein
MRNTGTWVRGFQGLKQILYQKFISLLTEPYLLVGKPFTLIKDGNNVLCKRLPFYGQMLCYTLKEDHTFALEVCV